MNGLSKVIGEIVMDVIKECGAVHNFDASEMIRNLNLENICVSIPKKDKKEKVVKEKVVKEKVVKEKAVKEKVVKEKVVKEKKEKGRPKKPRRQIELVDDSTDLFAALVAKANEDSEEEECSSSEESVKSVLDGMIDSITEAEKEEIKQAKIQKKAAKLAETQKKEAEKAEKEAAKLAETQKKEAEKAEKEAAKLAEIKKKEAEKAEKEAAKQKIADLKAEMEKLSKTVTKKPTKEKKESSSESESDKKAAKPVEKKAAKPVEKKAAAKQSDKKGANIEVEEEDTPDVVKRFEFEGVKYLKSKNTGIIYNMEQDVIGKWNEKTNKIDFEEAGSEEEEEEYDE
jgi:colicin import membrane protein